MLSKRFAKCAAIAGVACVGALMLVCFYYYTNYISNKSLPPKDVEVYDLSQYIPLELTGHLDELGTYSCEQQLKTNSTQICITNQSQGKLKYFLYDVSIPDEFIANFEIEPNEERQFTNLTASKLYFIVISARPNQEFKSTISE